MKFSLYTLNCAAQRQRMFQLPAFQHTIFVEGTSQDLDSIPNLEPFLTNGIAIIKHSGGGKLSQEEMNQLMRGKVVQTGTSKLEIRFNGNKEALKQYILKQFPNVSITEKFKDA